VEKDAQKYHHGILSNFQKNAQTKQSPNGRKSSQSGHPA
jgi:hypothetical protein